MRIAFYAPLKAPTHPVPSGDRRVARALVAALSMAGHEVRLASRFRSFEGDGDPVRQARIAKLGSKIADRLIARWERGDADARPDLWFTYHLHHKAPDWLGPTVAAALGIPYLVAEASVAAKQANGPWAKGYQASLAALADASTVFLLNPADRDGLLPVLSARARLVTLAPFLDTTPFVAARMQRAKHRAQLRVDIGLPEDEPWLVAVAMMRAGAKLDSYRLLGRALEMLCDRPWRLLVVGDGPARPAVLQALAPLGARVSFLGARDETEMPRLLAACDLAVWPAIGEAFGMALLEAQAAGVPVVAGRGEGVAAIVDHLATGVLVGVGDAAAFADAVTLLLGAPARRAALGDAAAGRASRDHDLRRAAITLSRALGPA